MPKSYLFETVLASTVHDMKNSLSQLMSQLDEISQRLEHDKENQQAVSSLRYESSRINLSLMELLTLYKLDKDQLSINIDEVEVIDFIEDCIASHSLMARNKDIQINLDCDESLIWFFDSNLVGIAINNILGNCIRYAQNQVLVTVKKVDGFNIIQIDDDGDGYPESMLDDAQSNIKGVNSSSGSTNLGLFFSTIIAQEHQRMGKQGRIQLDNAQLSSGGCFQFILP